MPSPLLLAAYRSTTTIPGSIVDRCASGGKSVQGWLDIHWSHIKARLVKRYAVESDFQGGDVPEKIIEWLVILTDIDVWKCVGGVPEGREDGWADKDRERVESELKEAANADSGLFELPAKASDALGASAVNKGGPLLASSTTIYGWYDKQQADVGENGW